MSESTDRRRKSAAAAAGDRSEFTVTEFGRRRVAGRPWSLRRAAWVLLWPFAYLRRRRTPRSSERPAKFQSESRGEPPRTGR